ncbi:hypothetical protein EDB81DRAFT_753944 [Dactylonectria macrodidyma]|uniref:Uncharacterized protein n=1 Tax=Dactylonectria macrodidyma TaxID=307937 RepID=A0A9P9FLF8_9HYPO|nr:hypothetical protein EDB81DRAFT_753944 [Dactylonectria macrodidyma]
MFSHTAISSLFVLLPGLATALPRGDSYAPGVDALDWKSCDIDLPESRKRLITGRVDCATLKDPLDYTYPKSDDTLDLQLVKVNATKQPARANVIFNPGCPRGPSVEEASVLGYMYRDTLGGKFNVIGFNAYGTGGTSPFSCPTENGTSGSDSTSLSHRNPYSDLPP